MKIITFIIITFTPYCLLSSIEIDSDNYKTLVENSKAAWLILYHSLRCESCQQFEPIWNDAINNIKSVNISIGEVNVDNPKGIELANNLNALKNGIPTVIFRVNSNEEYTIMKGSDKINAKKFNDDLNKILKKYSKTDIDNNNIDFNDYYNNDL